MTHYAMLGDHLSRDGDGITRVADLEGTQARERETTVAQLKAPKKKEHRGAMGSLIHIFRIRRNGK
jgi:hypothetical protein